MFPGGSSPDYSDVSADWSQRPYLDFLPGVEFMGVLFFSSPLLFLAEKEYDVEMWEGAPCHSPAAVFFTILSLFSP